MLTEKGSIKCKQSIDQRSIILKMNVVLITSGWRLCITVNNDFV